MNKTSDGGGAARRAKLESSNGNIDKRTHKEKKNASGDNASDRNKFKKSRSHTLPQLF